MSACSANTWPGSSNGKIQAEISNTRHSPAECHVRGNLANFRVTICYTQSLQRTIKPVVLNASSPRRSTQEAGAKVDIAAGPKLAVRITGLQNSRQI